MTDPSTERAQRSKARCWALVQGRDQHEPTTCAHCGNCADCGMPPRPDPWAIIGRVLDVHYNPVNGAAYLKALGDAQAALDWYREHEYAG